MTSVLGMVAAFIGRVVTPLAAVVVAVVLPGVVVEGVDCEDDVIEATVVVPDWVVAPFVELIPPEVVETSLFVVVCGVVVAAWSPPLLCSEAGVGLNAV